MRELRWNFIVRTHEPGVTKKANLQVDAAITACSEALIGGMGAMGTTPFVNKVFSKKFLVKVFTSDFLGVVCSYYCIIAESFQGKARIQRDNPFYLASRAVFLVRPFSFVPPSPDNIAGPTSH